MEEIPNNHLGCMKPCKWDKLPTSTGEFTGFLVAIGKGKSTIRINPVKKGGKVD